MKLKTIIGITAIALLHSTFSYAQQTTGSGITRVSGKIVEADATTPISMAVIRILSLKDSTLVTGVPSDAYGNFEISNLRIGNYLLQASFTGYKSVFKNISISTKQREVKLSPITLQEDQVLLNETVIKAAVQAIVVKEDTVEYNPMAYKTEPNAMVVDLLKKLPGVEIDSEGKITSGGQEIKKILVDGKEFFSSDPQIASNNLPVEMIEKVQVVDRKSDIARLTGVDDGEEEKVINLTIRPGMKKGWNTQFTGGLGDITNPNVSDEVRKNLGNAPRYVAQANAMHLIESNQYAIVGNSNNINNQGFTDMSGGGMYSRRSGGQGGGSAGINTAHSVAGNFNIGKDDKFRVGGDVNYTSTNRNTWSKSSTQNFLKDSTYFDGSERRESSLSQSIRGDFRIQWQIDSLTTVDIRPNAEVNWTNSNENRFTYTAAGNRQNNGSWASGDSINDNTSNSISNAWGYSYNISGTISRKSMYKSGRQYSLTLGYRDGYSIDHGHDENEINYYLRDSVSHINQQIEDGSRRQNFTLRLTYVEPIFTRSFLNISYDYRNSLTESEKLVYDWGTSVLDSTYSSIFRSKNITQNLNASIRSVREKYNYNIGLTLTANTRGSSDQINTNRNVRDTTVFNIAPAINFVYLWSRQQNLRLFYRGQTRQPSINQLQSTQTITNPLRIRLGNPNLVPTYSNMFRAIYRYNMPETQQIINASINGNYDVNSIVNKTDYNPETGVQTTMPVNISGVWDVSGRFMFNTPLGKSKLFQLNTTTTAGYNNQLGYIRTTKRESSQLNKSGTVSLGEDLRFSYRSNKFDIGIAGRYQFESVKNSIDNRNDQNTHNLRASLDGKLYLPFNITISSDVAYNDGWGYTAGYNLRSIMWNAQASMSLLKKNALTITARINDILQQRITISRTVSATSITDREINVLPSYFMVSATYKLNQLGGRSSNRQGPPAGEPGMERMRNSGGFGGGGPMGGGPGGF